MEGLRSKARPTNANEPPAEFAEPPKAADYTQELDPTASSPPSGTVGDAYDNTMAESFVDTFKTELIADRIWRSRSQLELAVVEYIAWFNNDRLHDPWAISHLPSSSLSASLRRSN